MISFGGGHNNNLYGVHTTKQVCSDTALIIFKIEI